MLMLTCVDIVVPDDVDLENLVWTRFRNLSFVNILKLPLSVLSIALFNSLEVILVAEGKTSFRIGCVFRCLRGKRFILTSI